MKKLMVLAAVLSFSSAFANEIDLRKADTVDGFCTMDTLGLVQQKTKKDPTRREASFLSEATGRAKAIYLNYMRGSRPEQLKVESTLKEGTKLVSGGAIVVVDMDGDEDQVTFYFKAEPAEIAGFYKPSLKMALHDEQSATAFWVCE